MNGTRTERHGRWRAALLAVALAFGLTGQGAVAAAPLADPLAVEAALADLQSTEWLLRYAALQTLVRHGVNPGEPLRRLVREEPRPWLRGQALLALVRLGDPTGRAQTVALATAPEPELRQAVMLALPSLGRNDETAKLLQAGLADPVPAVRQHALLALPALDGATALPTLVERLDGPDAVTASFAARALADIRTPAARTALPVPSAADCPAASSRRHFAVFAGAERTTSSPRRKTFPGCSGADCGSGRAMGITPRTVSPRASPGRSPAHPAIRSPAPHNMPTTNNARLRMSPPLQRCGLSPLHTA